MTTDTENRAEVTLRALQQASDGMLVTGDGRIGEADAAKLLGYEAETLAKKRAEGKGPPSYRLAVGSARISYRLYDLAIWIECSRDGD
jgi:hypothetical protein